MANDPYLTFIAVVLRLCDAYEQAKKENHTHDAILQLEQQQIKEMQLAAKLFLAQIS